MKNKLVTEILFYNSDSSEKNHATSPKNNHATSPKKFALLSQFFLKEQFDTFDK